MQSPNMEQRGSRVGAALACAGGLAGRLAKMPCIVFAGQQAASTR